MLIFNTTFQVDDASHDNFLIFFLLLIILRHELNI